MNNSEVTNYQPIRLKQQNKNDGCWSLDEGWSMVDCLVKRCHSICKENSNLALNKITKSDCGEVRDNYHKYEQFKYENFKNKTKDIMAMFEKILKSSMETLNRSRRQAEDDDNDDYDNEKNMDLDKGMFDSITNFADNDNIHEKSIAQELVNSFSSSISKTTPSESIYDNNNVYSSGDNSDATESSFVGTWFIYSLTWFGFGVIILTLLVIFFYFKRNRSLSKPSIKTTVREKDVQKDDFDKQMEELEKSDTAAFADAEELV